MDRGDLRDVLYALKCHGSPLDTTLTWHCQKITIALHISHGLAYMHSHSPKVIHRDLKSRKYNEQADVFSFCVVLSELDTDDYSYWNSVHVPGG
ncbi:hypothetical protein PsorP6_016907 [Peronosclerospora sorghi]|uniref:Uncharacterized protein n=1 Tax=Peronosclerospora sorghi TaxID=230839 RepID=A0ACC0WEC9_9STRA|nr:hypothetical protein PsorP6_016907 [Peronosclerospora sorghi]